MSSVEQKIREVLEDIAIEYGEYPSPDTINVDKATQAILQIIESDVIGEDIQWQLDRNQLRAEQRANLREDK